MSKKINKIIYLKVLIIFFLIIIKFKSSLNGVPWLHDAVYFHYISFLKFSEITKFSTDIALGQGRLGFLISVPISIFVINLMHVEIYKFFILILYFFFIIRIIFLISKKINNDFFDILLIFFSLYIVQYNPAGPIHFTFWIILPAYVLAETFSSLSRRSLIEKKSKLFFYYIIIFICISFNEWGALSAICFIAIFFYNYDKKFYINCKFFLKDKYFLKNLGFIFFSIFFIYILPRFFIDSNYDGNKLSFQLESFIDVPHILFKYFYNSLPFGAMNYGKNFDSILNNFKFDFENILIMISALACLVYFFNCYKSNNVDRTKFYNILFIFFLCFIVINIFLGLTEKYKSLCLVKNDCIYFPYILNIIFISFILSIIVKQFYINSFFKFLFAIILIFISLISGIKTNDNIFRLNIEKHKWTRVKGFVCSDLDKYHPAFYNHGVRFYEHPGRIDKKDYWEKYKKNYLKDLDCKKIKSKFKRSIEQVNIALNELYNDFSFNNQNYKNKLRIINYENFEFKENQILVSKGNMGFLYFPNIRKENLNIKLSFVSNENLNLLAKLNDKLIQYSKKKNIITIILTLNKKHNYLYLKDKLNNKILIKNVELIKLS